MKDAETEAILNKFAFLKKYVGRYFKYEYVELLEVKTIDGELLGLTPYWWRVPGAMGFEHPKHFETILLLDENGKLLTNVGKRRKHWWQIWKFGRTEETIEGVILENKLELRLHYILCFCHDRWCQSRWLILYKTPQDMTISQLIEINMQVAEQIGKEHVEQIA